MIYIRTVAYNASDTLHRAVDSVLNQTYTDFCYYLCENGSTDDGKTRRIVEEYAKLDNRVVAGYNKNNHIWEDNKEILYLPHTIGDNDLFCILDADDEYLPTFFQEILAFIDEHNLDIAACGSDFLNATNNCLLMQRLLSQSLILRENDFVELFTEYHQFMRTVWGKMFRGKVLRNTILDFNAPRFPRAYGNDTVFTMSAFRDAECVGILAKSLHRYYISDSSTSYVMHPERVESDQILYETAIEYLKPYGKLNTKNDYFLKLVYFNAITDTIRVLLNSHIEHSVKIQNIQNIFRYKATKELFDGNYVTDKKMDEEIRTPITQWLVSQKETRTREGKKVTIEILSAMYNHLTQIFTQDNLSCLLGKMPELTEALVKKDYSRILDRIRIWFKRHENDDFPLTELEIAIYHMAGKTDAELFTLLMDIRYKRPNSSEKLNIDNQIGTLLNKYDLLQNFNIELGCAFPKTVTLILQNNYLKALDEFITASQVVEIAEGDAESCILFGITLSAAAENADAYIYFKKVWVSYLLDNSNVEEAHVILDEFEKILPDDEDFTEMRKRLSACQNETGNNAIV